MIESQAVNEWKAEGRTAGKAEAIVDILEAQFAPVPEEVKSTVRGTTDLAVLKRWVVLAARAASLDDFRRDAGI